MAPVSCCSTSLLDLNSTLYTSAAIFLDLAQIFLRMLIHVYVANFDLAFCAVSAFFAIWYFSASSTFVGLGVGGGGDCDQLLVVICKGVVVDDLLVVDSGGDSGDKLHVVVKKGVSCDDLLGVDNGVSCSGELHVTVGGEGVRDD